MFACDKLTAEIEQVLRKKTTEECQPLSLGSESLDLNSLPKAWREGEAVVIGYWPCFEGPELRAALLMVNGPVRIRRLTDPEIPSPYRIRRVPLRAAEESLADWIKRRRAAMDMLVSGYDDDS